MRTIRHSLLLALALVATPALADPVLGAALQHYLQPFKTFDGQPIEALLARYGAAAIAAEVTPIGGGSDIVDLTVRTEHFKLPCAALRDWFVDADSNTGRGDATVEFRARGGRMPSEPPDAKGDPVLYWLQTGRCVQSAGQG